ncbi:MAG: hypothetical protein NXH85_13840 [Pseudomonadaceae bacterium]|nr:hypothetical protein [Pseudomonadaceae bacterium]
MSRSILPRGGLLLLALSVLPGCTAARINASAGDALQAIDLRSGIEVSRLQGFRLSPTTPVFLQHRGRDDGVELDVALTGLARVFYQVSPADPDALPAMGLLMVLEPPATRPEPALGLRVRLLPIEHLLPKPAASAVYRVHLLDLAANQVVDVVELTIDPAMYRRDPVGAALLAHGFERFGRALVSPSDA